MITLWPSIYDIRTYETFTGSWEDFVASLHHCQVAAKDKAPGFGPYVLKDTDTPCPKHPGISAPHRCDAAVKHLTMAVFDVDEGTEDQIHATEEALVADNIATLWYSTYSYAPDHPAYRLVIPLKAPLAPAHWPAVRRHLLSKYAIPANPNKCGGVSHFYYLPSHPPDAAAYTYLGADWGDPLDLSAFVAGLASTSPVSPTPTEVKIPEDPDTPVDMRLYRESLERRLRSLRQSKDPRDQRRARWLANALEGRSLAEHGERNDAMVSVTGTIVCCPYLSEAPPPSVVWHLVRPSWEAMVAAGSSLTQEEVDGMIQRAYTLRAKIDADRAAEKKRVAALVDRLFGTETTR